MALEGLRARSLLEVSTAGDGTGEEAPPVQPPARRLLAHLEPRLQSRPPAFHGVWRQGDRRGGGDGAVWRGGRPASLEADLVH